MTETKKILFVSMEKNILRVIISLALPDCRFNREESIDRHGDHFLCIPHPKL